MFIEHRHAVKHESNGLRGTKCYGCNSVEVLERKRCRILTEVYWCESVHGYIDPKAVKCPLAGD